MASEKWLNATTTISRRELADIMGDEINRSLAVAKIVNADSIYNLLKDFLPEYSARVAARIFKDVPEEEEDFTEETNTER